MGSYSGGWDSFIKTPAELEADKILSEEAESVKRKKKRQQLESYQDAKKNKKKVRSVIQAARKKAKETSELQRNMSPDRQEDYIWGRAWDTIRRKFGIEVGFKAKYDAGEYDRIADSLYDKILSKQESILEGRLDLIYDHAGRGSFDDLPMITASPEQRKLLLEGRPFKRNTGQALAELYRHLPREVLPRVLSQGPSAIPDEYKELYNKISNEENRDAIPKLGSHGKWFPHIATARGGFETGIAIGKTALDALGVPAGGPTGAIAGASEALLEIPQSIRDNPPTPEGFEEHYPIPEEKNSTGRFNIHAVNEEVEPIQRAVFSKDDDFTAPLLDPGTWRNVGAEAEEGAVRLSLDRVSGNYSSPHGLTQTLRDTGNEYVDLGRQYAGQALPDGTPEEKEELAQSYARGIKKRHPIAGAAIDSGGIPELITDMGLDPINFAAGRGAIKAAAAAPFQGVGKVVGGIDKATGGKILDTKNKIQDKLFWEGPLHQYSEGARQADPAKSQAWDEVHIISENAKMQAETITSAQFSKWRESIGQPLDDASEKLVWDMLHSPSFRKKENQHMLRAVFLDQLGDSKKADKLYDKFNRYAEVLDDVDTWRGGFIGKRVGDGKAEGSVKGVTEVGRVEASYVPRAVKKDKGGSGIQQDKKVDDPFLPGSDLERRAIDAKDIEPNAGKNVAAYLTGMENEFRGSLFVQGMHDAGEQASPMVKQVMDDLFKELDFDPKNPLIKQDGATVTVDLPTEKDMQSQSELVAGLRGEQSPITKPGSAEPPPFDLDQHPKVETGTSEIGAKEFKKRLEADQLKSRKQSAAKMKESLFPSQKIITDEELIGNLGKADPKKTKAAQKRWLDKMLPKKTPVAKEPPAPRPSDSLNVKNKDNAEIQGLMDEYDKVAPIAEREVGAKSISHTVDTARRRRHALDIEIKQADAAASQPKKERKPKEFVNAAALEESMIEGIHKSYGEKPPTASYVGDEIIRSKVVSLVPDIQTGMVAGGKDLGDRIPFIKQSLAVDAKVHTKQSEALEILNDKMRGPKEVTPDYGVSIKGETAYKGKAGTLHIAGLEDDIFDTGRKVADNKKQASALNRYVSRLKGIDEHLKAAEAPSLGGKGSEFDKLQSIEKELTDIYKSHKEARQKKKINQLLDDARDIIRKEKPVKEAKELDVSLGAVTQDEAKAAAHFYTEMKEGRELAAKFNNVAKAAREGIPAGLQAKAEKAAAKLEETTGAASRQYVNTAEEYLSDAHQALKKLGDKRQQANLAGNTKAVRFYDDLINNTKKLINEDSAAIRADEAAESYAKAGNKLDEAVGVEARGRGEGEMRAISESAKVTKRATIRRLEKQLSTFTNQADIKKEIGLIDELVRAYVAGDVEKIRDMQSSFKTRLNTRERARARRAHLVKADKLHDKLTRAKDANWEKAPRKSLEAQSKLKAKRKSATRNLARKNLAEQGTSPAARKNRALILKKINETYSKAFKEGLFLGGHDTKKITSQLNIHKKADTALRKETKKARKLLDDQFAGGSLVERYKKGVIGPRKKAVLEAQKNHELNRMALPERVQKLLNEIPKGQKGKKEELLAKIAGMVKKAKTPEDVAKAAKKIRELPANSPYKKVLDDMPEFKAKLEESLKSAVIEDTSKGVKELAKKLDDAPPPPKKKKTGEPGTSVKAFEKEPPSPLSKKAIDLGKESTHLQHMAEAQEFAEKLKQRLHEGTGMSYEWADSVTEEATAFYRELKNPKIQMGPAYRRITKPVGSKVSDKATIMPKAQHGAMEDASMLAMRKGIAGKTVGEHIDTLSFGITPVSIAIRESVDLLKAVNLLAKIDKTSLNPIFPIINTAGGIAMSGMALGVKEALSPRALRSAIMVSIAGALEVGGDARNKWGKMTVTLRDGLEVPIEQLIKMGYEDGQLGQLAILQNKKVRAASTHTGKAGMATADWVSRVFGGFQVFPEQVMGHKIRVSKILNSGAKAVSPGFASEISENFQHMMTYVNSLEGKKMADGSIKFTRLARAKAAKKANTFTANYRQLNYFEKNVMKDVAYFYPWTRKVIPLVVKGVQKNPHVVAKYMHRNGYIEQKNGKYYPSWKNTMPEWASGTGLPANLENQLGFLRDGVYTDEFMYAIYEDPRNMALPLAVSMSDWMSGSESSAADVARMLSPAAIFLGEMLFGVSFNTNKPVEGGRMGSVKKLAESTMSRATAPSLALSAIAEAAGIDGKRVAFSKSARDIIRLEDDPYQKAAWQLAFGVANTLGTFWSWGASKLGVEGLENKTGDIDSRVRGHSVSKTQKWKLNKNLGEMNRDYKDLGE